MQSLRSQTSAGSARNHVNISCELEVKPSLSTPIQRQELIGILCSRNVFLLSFLTQTRRRSYSVSGRVRATWSPQDRPLSKELQTFPRCFLEQNYQSKYYSTTRWIERNLQTPSTVDVLDLICIRTRRNKCLKW